MFRVFDNYIMVDWSSASKPNQGSDSIWIGIFKRDVRLQLRFEHFNPSTRHQALEIIREQLLSFQKRGDKTLLGFDFGFGYPHGFAEALKLTGTPWEAMFEFLSKELIDKNDNDNNRFQIASKINRLISNGPQPFWGCPAKFVNSFLQPKKSNLKLGFAENRACDIAAKTASSVFKLYAPGSVGSQTLTGIPYVQKLRQEFKMAKIWPFETGFKAIERDDMDNFEIMICEIYPSMLKVKAEAGETKDLAQVRAIGHHFAKLDDEGKLREIFAPIKALDEAEKDKAIKEEGWILGL